MDDVNFNFPVLVQLNIWHFLMFLKKQPKLTKQEFPETISVKQSSIFFYYILT